MKKMILLIALLFSVAGAQLMADGCNACAMKHGASKEERQAKKEQKKKNRKKRKEERENKKHQSEIN
jgi:Ni/Co efflux regulator RcnB